MERLRNALMRGLLEADFNPAEVSKVLSVFDSVSMGYKLQEAETGLIIPHNLHELAKTYLAVRAIEGLSKNTLYNYRLDLEKFFSHITCPIDQITGVMIRGYLYYVQSTRKISNERLDKIRGTLATFFAWAADEEYLPRNPMRSIKAIKHTKKQRKSLTRAQVEKLRRACETVRDRAVFDALCSSGCRVSELISIKLEDMTYDGDVARVTIIGKGNKQREIQFNPMAVISIRAYLMTRTDNSPWLFVAGKEPHNQLSRESIAKIIKAIGKRGGVPWVSPHILRHTFATFMLASGVPVQDIQIMLGHSQINTTMIYAQVDKDHVRSEQLRCVV